MSSIQLETLSQNLEILKLKIPPEEMATFMIDEEYTCEQIDAVEKLFDHFSRKQQETTVQFLLKCSRLPMKNPRTFDNFNFSELSGKGVEKLKSIRTLNPLYAHKNLAFIGPAGTGKTHLAMAFAHECCCKMMKAYFIKMSELNDMFTEARKYGRENRVINAMVKPSCIVLDEVGYCNFDLENTRLFFDMVDRRYNKDGAYNMIFTSNKQPKFWKQNFTDEDSLRCAMDRLFDSVMIFNFTGASHRGKDREAFTLTTKVTKTVSDSIQEIE